MISPHIPLLANGPLPSPQIQIQAVLIVGFNMNKVGVLTLEVTHNPL
jgi:hypothetical protein